MNVTANAYLTKITAAGTADRYGDPVAGSDVWTGRAAGYLKRMRRIGQAPAFVSAGGAAAGRAIDIKTDVFTILNAAGAPILEAAGPDWEASTVTIEDRRTATPVTRVFRVIGMENRAAGTIVDSVRLELEPVSED